MISTGAGKGFCSGGDVKAMSEAKDGRRERPLLEKIAPGRDLKCEPRQRVGRAGLERDRLEALFARKQRALAVALEEGEADNLGIVGDLPTEIGRGQRGVAEPAHLDHFVDLPTAAPGSVTTTYGSRTRPSRPTRLRYATLRQIRLAGKGVT